MDDLDNDLSGFLGISRDFSGFLGISRDFGRTVAGNASQEEARMAVAVMLATARVLMMTDDNDERNNDGRDGRGTRTRSLVLKTLPFQRRFLHIYV
jgi:hypothetical protein